MTALSLTPVTLSLPRAGARLDPLTLDHADDLFAAAHDRSIWKYIPYPYGGASSLNDMRALIERALDAHSRGGELPFAIIDTQSGRAVGSTRYLDIQPANRALEIGATWIDPRFQRTSINTECKYLLLRHAFETMWPSPDGSPEKSGAVRVQLKSDARNTRSQAAMLRIGATFEGVLRRHRILTDGFVRDTAYFSIIREEWPTVKQRLHTMIAGAP